MGIEKHDGHDHDPAGGHAGGLALDLAALTRVLLGVTPGAPVVPVAATADEPEREPVVREEQGHGGLSASRRSGAMLAELSFLDD
ncbi:MAG: hypothetical protein Q8O61_20585 [Nocardioides sp.]|nr:hypothetical protein [Nocardioides sp.]